VKMIRERNVRPTTALMSISLAALLATPFAGPATANPRSQLTPGQALSWPTPCPPGVQCVGGYDAVTSTDGSTILKIVGGSSSSPGGTLVLQGPNVSWSSGIQGAVVAIMQTDGNFVAYDVLGREIWSSGTSGNPGAFLRIDPSAASIFTPTNTLRWRATYTVQSQCQAAMHVAQAQNLKVTLDPSAVAAFATALADPIAAQCEANVLNAATASLPTAACTIAETLPLDPSNSPGQAATEAFQQAEGNAGGQFYANCYSPYIAKLDDRLCTSFCESVNNLRACHFTTFTAR
jgi:hypothetical protein